VQLPTVFNPVNEEQATLKVREGKGKKLDVTQSFHFVTHDVNENTSSKMSYQDETHQQWQ